MKNLTNGLIMPLLCLSAIWLTACEKPLMSEEEEVSDDPVEVTEDTEGGLVMYVEGLRSHCTRLNYVVFQDGQKLKTYTQKTGDTGFGQKSLVLTPGTYQLLLLAYDGSSNPTISSLEKITFGNKNPGMSDVFYAYQEVTVGEEPVVLHIPLHNAAATFQLRTTDGVPEGVSRIRFYYTGGSSTLSALTGKGNANSRQEVIFEISPEQEGLPLLMELFSFPLEGKTVKMQITVSAGDQVLLERQYDDISLISGSLLRYEGPFFSGQGGEMQKIYLTPF